MTLANPEQDEKSRIALEVAPGVRQEQILAPQLRASLRVLQMDLPALVQEVKHEIEVNPVVEADDVVEMPVVSDELQSHLNNEEALPESPVEDESNPSVNIDEDAAERRQRFFDRQVASESLQEHLLAQLGAAGLSGKDREIAELIIGDIDDDGRYVGLLEDLQSVLNIPMEQLEATLKRVQTFDPPGVGGRNLRECLSIQVRQLEIDQKVRALILAIISKHLTAVARRDIKSLARRLAVPEAECQAAIAALRRLDPKPGRQFVASGKGVQFIRPELEVEMTDSGIVLTSCENTNLPTFTINPIYQEMLNAEDTSRETRQYLKQHIGSAEMLQDAIRRRGETIMRVAESVFAVQYDFFANGFESIRPLTIEEVAHKTGFHGTTVGRAVRGKYVRTPRGVFELSRFFCAGWLKRHDQGVVSATSVKHRLARLIADEKGVVMTDEKLVKELCKSGVKISRRTVAKYRAGLGIPSAAERNRRRKMA